MLINYLKLVLVLEDKLYTQNCCIILIGDLTQVVVTGGIRFVPGELPFLL
jgi:hypothetical protein